MSASFGSLAAVASDDSGMMGLRSLSVKEISFPLLSVSKKVIGDSVETFFSFMVTVIGLLSFAFGWSGRFDIA
jgi:hypothetical protein